MDKFTIHNPPAHIQEVPNQMDIQPNIQPESISLKFHIHQKDEMRQYKTEEPLTY